MSEKKVPVDPGLTPGAVDGALDREALELELLDFERALRRLQNREASQRYWLRWISVGIGVLVVAGMAAMMWYLVQETGKDPSRILTPGFAVAMIVAPITSITAITVALFVGAFRRFEDKDMESISNTALNAARVFRG